MDFQSTKCNENVVNSKSVFTVIDITEVLMKQQEYKKAISILTGFIEDRQGIDKIQLMVKQVKCHLHLGESNEAMKMCLELISIINFCKCVFVIRDKCIGCERDISDIAKQLSELNEIDVALDLTKCVFKLIKCFYAVSSVDESVKIDKMQQLAELILKISRIMSSQNIEQTSKPHLRLMVDMLYEVINVQCLNVKFKCIRLTRFFLTFGLCCYEAKQHSRSMEVFRQSVRIMVEGLGKEVASKYYLLGECYSRLGIAYYNLRQLVHCEEAFKNALAALSSATDIPSEKQKESAKQLILYHLNIVTQQLHES